MVKKPRRRLRIRAGDRSGEGLFALTGAAWPDPVAALVIAVFVIHEGREAWEGELGEDDD